MISRNYVLYKNKQYSKESGNQVFYSSSFSYLLYVYEGHIILIAIGQSGRCGNKRHDPGKGAKKKKEQKKKKRSKAGMYNPVSYLYRGGSLRRERWGESTQGRHRPRN